MGYDIEKEKREAIEAGQRALSSLRTAKENLNSAKNWGLVDMFGGGSPPPPSPPWPPPGGGFVYARSKRRFAPDKKARSSQSAVSWVTTGFPSASSSGVNPPAYPLTIKR